MGDQKYLPNNMSPYNTAKIGSEESWTTEETCYYSDFSEKLSISASVRNSCRVKIIARTKTFPRCETKFSGILRYKYITEYRTGGPTKC